MLNRRVVVLGTIASAGSAKAQDTFRVWILNNGVDGHVKVWVDQDGAKELLWDKDMAIGDDEVPLTVNGSPPKLFYWEHVAKADGKTRTDSDPYDAEDRIPIESA